MGGGGEEQMGGRSNRMYNVGVYYLEFPQCLRMTAIEKRNLICFFCYIIKGYLQPMRKFQIITPHIIHPIAFPPSFALLPPISPIRNLKNDPPQVGESYLPPSFWGRTLCYRSYIYPQSFPTPRIHKICYICTARISLYFQISIGVRFPESYWVQVPVKINRSLCFFVYNSGTKYG